MPIVMPEHVRTPAEIAATHVDGEPTARCTCGALLVELPRWVRLPIPREGREPLLYTLTHAHVTGSRDACSIPEPVPCDAVTCDLPAVPNGDYCAHCEDAR